MSFLVTIFLLAVALVLVSTDGLQANRWNVLNLRSGSDSVSLSFMSLVVFGVYMHRFSQWADDTLKPTGYPPRPVQNFTTWLQFLFWGSVYGLIGCSIMLVIYKYPALLDPLRGQAFVGSFVELLIPEGSENLNPLALGVAVALGFLTIPKLEPAFRRRLQQAALIPSRATHIVNSLIRDFNSFSPDAENLKKFAKDTDTDPNIPKIFKDELSIKVDDHYLEVYPRLEYLVWRINELKMRPGFELAISPHNADLDKLEPELERVRREVVSAARTTALIAERLELDIDSVHKAACVDREGKRPLAITVLDNLLRSAKEKSSTDQVVRALVSTTDTKLRILRASCDEMLNNIIKACVLAAFTANAQSPESWLKRVGFDYSGGVADGPDGDTLVRSMLTAILTVIAVVTGLAYVEQVSGVVVPAILGVSMTAASLVGGYFIGSLALNERNRSALEKEDVRFGTWYLLMIFCGSWASVILAIFACSVVLGTGYAPGSALFQNSVKYAHVSAILGPAIAYSCFRVSRGDTPLPSYYILLLPFISFLFMFVSVWLHFGEGFGAEKKAQSFLVGSMFTPLVAAVTLRYSNWRDFLGALKQLALYLNPFNTKSEEPSVRT
ncbi:hypothetical protein EOI86_03370 [Hwanghaeella grinnelliae]|uniref:Uncharacterized protein n=1 Tax=Hwanghaeella grinnelliae TaxID=2500179 RepID=A0A3S2VR13_9PROT|nr:hypothetical protein [Hwanghaeella grinnelliae]RVU38342.1 hypothetical protein EOI86_03370 [Hwanghaeella grinnelliae]